MHEFKVETISMYLQYLPAHKKIMQFFLFGSGSNQKKAGYEWQKLTHKSKTNFEYNLGWCPKADRLDGERKLSVKQNFMRLSL
jgi:hypothetical protein